MVFGAGTINIIGCGSSGPDCPAPQVMCSGVCADLSRDSENCGKCGTACAAGQVCNNSVCALDCSPGLSNCGGECVNQESDPAHCGDCVTACDPGEVCSAGACATTCKTGLTDCSSNCVDTDTDRAHCGDCVTSCDPGYVCSGGGCQLSCQADLTDCGGVCTNLDSDDLNCGGCGAPCPIWERCISGNCVVTVPYVPDANTVLLDHFDNSTSAAIQAYSENGAACGPAKPGAAPTFSFGPGPLGLDQALSLGPPAGQPAGSSTYLRYPGGQLLSQGNGTIEFWVFLTSYGTGLSLVDQGQYYGACMGWTFGMGVSSTGQLSASAWAAFNLNSGASTVPLNTWAHVAATWGGTGAKLYINGALVGSDANTGLPAAGFGKFVMMRLGTHAGVTTWIDELRISNIQRTAY